MDLKNNVTGIQHLGLPTADFEGTIAFYEGLGFDVTWRASDRNVAFLQMGEAVIETYSADEVHPVWGAWDHIALNVKDVDTAYTQIKEAGYEFAEGGDGPIFLPFLANGVRYFTIVGPNNEKVEFNQIL